MLQFRLSIGMILFSFVSVLVGLFLGLSDDPKWFGNFGALVVMFGVASEYSLLKHELRALYVALESQGAAVAGNDGIPDLRPRKLQSSLALASHVVIVLGTIVWGFGEWILNWMLKAV